MALGRIGDSDAVQPLLQTSSTDPFLSHAIVYALYEIGDVRSLPTGHPLAKRVRLMRKADLRKVSTDSYPEILPARWQKPDQDPTRSRAPAEQLLGLDWSGQLVHDGWSPYDAFSQAIHQQCNAHLIHRCNEMLVETATRGAARFPAAVKDLLQRGLALRNRYLDGEVSEHGLSVMAGRFTNELLCLVGVRKSDPANERLAKFLFEHQESVFNYLRYPGMDATNWRGEQAIRFGVVNRKVWGGNRTWPGAKTQSTLMSVIQTCAMRGLSPIRFLVNALTAPKPLLISAPQR